jgi:16S rRNA (guanine527-N7)-methyltransferase
MVSACRHLLAPGGAFYAMKAAVPEREVAATAELGFEAAVVPLSVPGLQGQRSLIVLRQESPPWPGS